MMGERLFSRTENGSFPVGFHASKRHDDCEVVIKRQLKSSAGDWPSSEIFGWAFFIPPRRWCSLPISMLFEEIYFVQIEIIITHAIGLASKDCLKVAASRDGQQKTLSVYWYTLIDFRHVVSIHAVQWTLLETHSHCKQDARSKADLLNRLPAEMKPDPILSIALWDGEAASINICTRSLPYSI